MRSVNCCASTRWRSFVQFIQFIFSHSFINITLLCTFFFFELLFRSILVCCFSRVIFIYFFLLLLCLTSRVRLLSGAFGFFLSFGKRLFIIFFVRSLSTIFHRNSVHTTHIYIYIQYKHIAHSTEEASNWLRFVKNKITAKQRSTSS